MTYAGGTPSDPGAPDKVGILVTNLGTPDAPERAAVRRYLKEFLWDPRVVEIPRPLWWLILNGVILNVRPARSAEAYQTVWTERGSPLMYHTSDFTDALREHMQREHGEDVAVEFAMRYGSPSIAEVAGKLLSGGVTRLVVLPMFPQYSGATSGSTFDALSRYLQGRREITDLRFVASYHDDPGYIAALANKIADFQSVHGRPDKLLFSYHGVPARYCAEGDPYRLQCLDTTRRIVQALDLPEDAYMTCFQSRFGREEWLQPYTDETLKALPGQGVQSVQVVCPGFSADCLETIEEIGVENRDYFVEAGGRDYAYIPCLNSDEEHVAAIARLLREQAAGWLDANPVDQQAQAAAAPR
ncbi:MAG: ferrochelatase [Halioglobus sp.]|nr:ferrochelatase [Halioglobus sp.]